MSNTKRQGSWFLTINNPSPGEEDIEGRLKDADLLKHIKYFKAAIESGEENKVRHVHIYLHMSENQRFAAIKKAFPRADIEAPIGTPQQQIDYIGNPDYLYSENHADEKKRGKRKGGVCERCWTYGNTQGLRLDKKLNGTGLDQRLLALKQMIDDSAEISDLYEADFVTMIRYGSKLVDYASVAHLARSLKNRLDKVQKDKLELPPTEPLTDNQQVAL